MDWNTSTLPNVLVYHGILVLATGGLCGQNLQRLGTTMFIGLSPILEIYQGLESTISIQVIGLKID